MENEYNFTLGERTISSNEVITQSNSIVDTHPSNKENKYIHIFPDSKESFRNSYTNILKNRNKRAISNSHSEEKINSQGRKRNSSEAPKKKNSTNPPLQSKKSINTVKNTLYQALKNINKELNVKIENREQSKVSFSLMNFIDQDPDQLIDSEEDVERVEVKAKADGFAKKMLKKVDIQTVLESFTDSMKDTQKNEEFLNTKENINFTLPNNPFAEKKSIDEIELDIPEIHQAIIEPPKNKSSLQIESEYIVNNDTPIYEELLNEQVILNQNIDVRKLIEILKLKNEIISQQSNTIETQAKEIQNLKINIESKQETIDREQFIELESNLKELQRYINKIEKENIILKNELGNSMKHKNMVLKKFNDELSNITKISQNFYEDFFQAKEENKLIDY